MSWLVFCQLDVSQGPLGKRQIQMGGGNVSLRLTHEQVYAGISQLMIDILGPSTLWGGHR